MATTAGTFALLHREATAGHFPAGGDEAADTHKQQSKGRGFGNRSLIDRNRLDGQSGDSVGDGALLNRRGHVGDAKNFAKTAISVP